MTANLTDELKVRGLYFSNVSVTIMFVHINILTYFHIIRPPLSRKQIFKDIPTIIQERKERTKKVDVSHSIKTLHTIRKSQSAMSLVCIELYDALD